MRTGSGRRGTRSAQLDQRDETNILRSCDDKRSRLSGERDHAGHCSGSKKARDTKDAIDGQHEKWAKMSFEKTTEGYRRQIEMA